MSEFESMVEFLDASYVLKNQIVPCLVGPVGIGKTEAVRQHAKNVGANNVVEIIASQILPNEVSGITMPDSDTKSMEIYDHFRLSSLEDGDILFFDELLEADQMVLSACLTLIESRQMMSGRKLPDIQIIAATNPTIKPTMLKENIRQRFVFKTFSIDPIGCRQFIKDDCGIDIGTEIARMVEETNNSYNILSQRSLTKMVRWMRDTPEEDRSNTANLIDTIWNNNLGSSLLQKFGCSSKMQQTRLALKKIIDDNIDSIDISEKLMNTINKDESFKNASITEIIEELKTTGIWDIFEKTLTETVFSVEDNNKPVRF